MSFPTWDTPITAESPCGIDIEYEPNFLLFQQSLEGKDEQQYGDTVISAEEPDWAKVIQQAENLLEHSKDLRVMAGLTLAWTALHGLTGLAAGCKMLVQNLSTYWEDIFPRLEVDEEFDPLYRINALGLLGAPTGILNVLVTTKSDTRTCKKEHYPF